MQHILDWKWPVWPSSWYNIQKKYCFLQRSLVIVVLNYSSNQNFGAAYKGVWYNIVSPDLATWAKHSTNGFREVGPEKEGKVANETVGKASQKATSWTWHGGESRTSQSLEQLGLWGLVQGLNGGISLLTWRFELATFWIPTRRVVPLRPPKILFCLILFWSVNSLIYSQCCCNAWCDIISQIYSNATDILEPKFNTM